MILDEYKGTFFPEFYDILHAKCNDFIAIQSIVEKYGKKVLELGCGTGRISIPLANYGCDVTCVEISGDMIKFFETKEYDRSKIRIVNCAAEEFMSNETFDVILMCNNFINNFSSIAQVVRCLKNCKQFMHDKSIIVIEEEVPEIALKKALDLNGEFEMEFETDGGTIIKDFFTVKYDILNQKEYDSIRIEEYLCDRLIRSATANDILYWYWPNEIRKAISDAGLRIKGESDGLFDLSFNGFSLDSDSMVFYAEK